MKKHILGSMFTLLLGLFAVSLVTAQDRESDVFERLPNALGSQNTVVNQAPFVIGGLHYQRWNNQTGYLVTASLTRDPDALADGSDMLFSYQVRGDMMRRLFSADVADWLSGALFVYGSLSQGGRMEVVTNWPDEEPPDPIPEDYVWPEPTYDLQPFIPYVGASVGVGFEVVLISHYSFIFELGYGPIVDIYPFALQSFGLGVTFGTGIRF